MESNRETTFTLRELVRGAGGTLGGGSDPEDDDHIVSEVEPASHPPTSTLVSKAELELEDDSSVFQNGQRSPPVAVGSRPP